MNRLDLTDPAERIFPRILRAQAEQNGETPFLLTEAQRTTYREADAITDRLAGGLQGLGLGAGDRVGLYLGNSPEFILLSLAANKLGAVWVPISTDYRGDWLLDAAARSRCKVIATDSEHQERLLPLRERLDIPHWIVLSSDAAEGGGGEGSARGRGEGSASGAGAGEAAAAIPEGCMDYRELAAAPPLASDYAAQDYGDTCAILWTSGTTGKSKGVMQNYNGWIRAIDQGAAPMFDSRPGDVVYCALPLFNTGAWITSVYRALLEGLPCAIEPGFSASRFWERIALFQATQVFLIGAMGVFLWNAPEKKSDADNTLRKAMVVPFPPDLREAFERRFGLEMLSAGLGMSECQMIANQLRAARHTDARLPPHALGYPPDDLELRLCDDDGKEVPDGEAGEIRVRPKAPHVLFNGYFDNLEATAASYQGGFFLTGDMARKDPETGALYFVDRKKDAVRFAGRNISTLEVEGVFRRHPAVGDVAAYGIPAKEVEGEDELKVDVVLKPGAEAAPEALCRFVNDNAPHYFVPKYLAIVDSLPYTPTNKVRKFLLREQGVAPGTWERDKAGFKVKR